MTPAKATTKILLGFYPPFDVSDPEAFIAGVTAIFAQYPPEVRRIAVDPVRGIPGMCSRLSLAEVRAACDRFYEPILRQLTRERALENFYANREVLTPVSEDSKSRVQAMAEDLRRQLGSTRRSAINDHGDGNHMQRITGDLARRHVPETK